MITRRKFLKRGLIFTPATGLIRASFAQSLNLADGPFIIASNIRDCSAAATVVNAWAARVIANGGAALSNATKAATQTFVCALQATTVWAKLGPISVFAPDNLIASTTPLIVAGGADPWALQGAWVAGDLTINGLAGDGATKRLDTQFIPSVGLGSGQNEGLSVYCFAPNAAGNTVGVASNAGTNFYQINCKFSDNNTYARIGAAANLITVASPGAGYYSANRVSATDQRLYFANSTTPHAQIGATDAINYAGAGAALQSAVFCLNNNGIFGSFNADRLSLVTYHLGLSAAESSTLFSATQTLRTSYGGGSV